MSEYQYYEFLAIDRPLSDLDRKALRARSTRAEITATSFTNWYDWGSFKGDASQWMDRWFDLHLYFANWGTRVLMIRLPRRLFDVGELKGLLASSDFAKLRVAGEHLVLEITRASEEPDEYEWYDEEDESSRLAAIAPIRTELLGGDLRLFTLLWLMTIEDELLEGEPEDPATFRDDSAEFDLLAGELDDEDRPEPMAGLGPLTPALEAVATFFRLNGDLVRAAAERSYATPNPSSEDARRVITSLSDRERLALLGRVYENDPLVAAELRRTVRQRLASASGPSLPAPRTANELVARARQFRDDRRRAAAEAAEAERRREAEQVERARRKRLDLLRVRGDAVWDEIETEVGRRNASGYDQAARLLTDLAELSEEQDRYETFERHLEDLRERHARKPRFIERLSDL